MIPSIPSSLLHPGMRHQCFLTCDPPPLLTLQEPVLDQFFLHRQDEHFIKIDCFYDRQLHD